MVATNTEELLPLPEAAERLGVSVYTVRRWIKDGKLRAFRPGKEYRVREEDLEEFLAAREVRPKVEAPPELEASAQAERRKGGPEVHTSGADLKGTGSLRAEGVVKIMQAVDEYHEGEISREELEERIEELVPA